MKLRRILALLLTALLCLCLTACGEKGPSYSPTKSPYAMKWECNAPQIAAENGEIHFYFMSGEGMNVNPENEKGQTEKWGDSCLVIFPDGKTMLIDGGFPIYASVLTENLQRLGVTHVDYVVLSHSHNDHYGGLESPQGPIKVLGASHGFYSSKFAPACMTENGLTTQQLLAGDTVQLGDVKLTCLSPSLEQLNNRTDRDPETNTNNASMVLRIDYKEFSHLVGCSRNKLHFGSDEKLAEKLGIVQGAGSVFNILNNEEHDVVVILDKVFQETPDEELTCFPANVNDATVTLAMGEVRRFLENMPNRIMEPDEDFTEHFDPTE